MGLFDIFKKNKEKENLRLSYKGYETIIHYSDEDNVFYGSIENIKDIVSFHFDDMKDAEKEFHLAVEDYIDLLNEKNNKKSEKKCEFNTGYYQDDYDDYLLLKELDNSVAELAMISYRKYEQIYAVRNIGINNERIIVVSGDISRTKCDCVVNAARPSLLGGGGVDGAIHFAAGPELLKECEALNGCDYGEAKITNAYNMHCKKIIHAVGPKWHGGDRNEAQILRNTYANALNLAIQNNLKTIALPAISCGNYGYPVEDGIDIALDVVMDYLRRYDDLRIIFVSNNEVFNYIKEKLG